MGLVGIEPTPRPYEGHILPLKYRPFYIKI